ncbi:MAG: asparagine synthetase B [Flavobacteriales bacterium]|nr:asparagine synthetase B [Flavobacteriales bacterium]MCX7649288.1 asparagine synthetase B [Flavobacteriales bacterium]MDW8431882.1 asparagine synthetase B [Flavobacteriales bacterium]
MFAKSPFLGFVQRIWIGLLFSGICLPWAHAGYILIPMDHKQENHLKAYGVAYWVLGYDVEMYWLLNYRGGSFMFKQAPVFEKELRIRGVSFEIISDAQSAAILTEIADPGVNMEAVRMEKAPKIAVYSPKDKQPWDDAVTLVLTYAEIPYDVIYDDEVLSDKLPLYDWLHLHHEDFTGQYGKFWAGYRNADWYKEEVRNSEATARRWGFSKVSQLKLAVAKKIKEFLAGGGYLFAMCSATDSYDIALAAEGVDICDYMFDGDPMDPQAQEKLDFSKTLAFTGFTISRNPSEYEYSTIDATNFRQVPRQLDFFTLFDFSAKWDIIPTMLTQNHEKVIPGFMGQTTAFRKQFIKNGVIILADNKAAHEARYIHGEFGRGFWSFYGGHDPEDYQHMVGDPPTNLALFPNSPGYRLILNNILFPAARKQKQKT